MSKNKQEDFDPIRKVANTMALAGLPLAKEDIEALEKFQNMSEDEREKERQRSIRELEEKSSKKR